MLLMGELMARVVPLALMGAISPTVLLATVIILTGRRPLPRVWTLIAGLVTIVLVVEFVGFILLGSVVVGHNSKLSAIVDLAVGALLLIGAAVIFLRPARKVSKKPTQDDRVHYAEFYAAGIILMATNFSTLAPLVIATKDIASATVEASAKAVLLAVITVIVLLPALVPLMITLTLPKRSNAILGQLSKMLRRHGRQIVAVVFGGIGIYLLISGLAGLSGS